MTKPRYSIIPGGAVIDQRLEPRDLHVLCFLGIHTDKLGWCFLAQGNIAKALNCSRASVQRSLARLAEFEWIEVRSSASANSRAHACHAYRVQMDRDDPEISPSEFEVEEQKREGGCPPVSTPAHLGWAPVPTIDGHGGAHVCMGTERPSKDSTESETRARDPLISDEATKLAWELAVIAGSIASVSDLSSLPPGWYGAPYRVNQFLREGYHPEILRIAAREVMASRKGKDPPWSVEYFAKAFGKVRSRQSAALPTIETLTETRGHHHAKPNGRSFKGALACLDDRIRELEAGTPESSQDAPRLLAHRRSK